MRLVLVYIVFLYTVWVEVVVVRGRKAGLLHGQSLYPQFYPQF